MNFQWLITHISVNLSLALTPNPNDMSYSGITRFSIGQNDSTVQLMINEGEHKLLPGGDFFSLICLRDNQPVVPQYLDQFNPADYGRQGATITDTHGGTKKGYLVDPVDSYHKPILVSSECFTTTVYEHYGHITYDAPVKPPRVLAPKGETLTLIYNTNKVKAFPVYKAYVHEGKLIRIEMTLVIENNTGLVLNFAANSELIFKVTDPNAAPRSRYQGSQPYGARTESVSACSVMLSPEATTAPVKRGETLTFSLGPSDIPIGNSVRLLKVITADEFTAEKYLWYHLDNNAMVWGYNVQFHMAFPAGQLYVIDQNTWDSIGMSNLKFPMIIPGKPTRLQVASTNDRIRVVKKTTSNGGKTTIYDISKNGDTDLKTTYLLLQNSTQGKITPEVPLVGGYYEFPADVEMVLVNEKVEVKQY